MLSQKPNGQWLEDQSQPPIYQVLGIDPHEGLIVAYMPAEMTSQDHHEADSGVALSVNGLLVDILGPAPVKYWKVRNLARALRLELPNPIWTGAAADFRVECLPTWTKPEGTVLMARQYGRGPWIELETKEQA